MEKVAIVTGASRGIGYAIAERLAKENYNLAICSRNRKEIFGAKKNLEKYNVKVLAKNLDVSNYKNVKIFVSKILKEFKRIDILVNNAGVLIIKPLFETKKEEIDYVIKVNLLAPFYFCKEVIPIMIKQNFGIIVNISSGAGKSGFENLSVYCASKFGLIGLTESLAKELSKNNIRVYAICPGPVKTRMQEYYLKTLPFHQRILVKSFMQKPEDIAEFVIKAINGYYKSGETIDTIYF